jgi:hypothetical protein
MDRGAVEDGQPVARVESGVCEAKPTKVRTDTFSTPFRIFRGVVMRNNIIRFVDTVTQGAGSEQGISLNGCENVLLEHNVIDATIQTLIGWVNCTNLRASNNRTSAGQLIPVQGVMMLADFTSVKRDDLSKVIEDAAILSVL